MPFRAVCLQQALACQIMLRRRGVEARLHYGVAIGERLEAHVWVSVGNRIVIGEEEAGRFRSLLFSRPVGVARTLLQILGVNTARSQAAKQRIAVDCFASPAMAV